MPQNEVIFHIFHFNLLLKLPAVLQAKQRAALVPVAEKGQVQDVFVCRPLWIWAEGILWSTLLLDSCRQDHTFRCVVLKELIKSLGNYFVFINEELGTTPEHSISIETVDSKQLPFLHSCLLLENFVLFLCFHPPKTPKLKVSSQRTSTATCARAQRQL